MLPKKILIKGTPYQIKRFRSSQDSKGQYLMGYCDTQEKIIGVLIGLNEHETLRTFYHECFHASLHEAHLSSNDGWVPTLVEEIIVDSILDMVMDYKHAKPKQRRKK